MPPSIFGRCGSQFNEKGAASVDFLKRGEFAPENKLGDRVRLRTFSIILPNTIHGSKKHLK
jgi:hypothetical protein